MKTSIATATLEEAEQRGVAPTAEQLARTRLYNDKLLRLPAEEAARIVVDGVEAGLPRILVGKDARAMDRVVRLLPARYPALSAWFERKVFGPTTS